MSSERAGRVLDDGNADRDDGTARRLAVVIVTYNSADVIENCLDSLADGLEGVQVTDVVVVDNASTDSSVQIAARSTVPGLRILQMGRNAGYAAAINAAVASLVDPGGVLILNPDIRLRPGCADALASALDQPGVGIVVPRLLSPAAEVHFSLRNAPSVSRALAEAILGGDGAAWLGDRGEVITEARRYQSAGPAPWATGAVLLVSGAALRDLGPWDESFLLYSEETDFALRAGDRGWVLWFEPRAEAEHVGGESGTNPMLHALQEVNRVRLFRRRNGPIAGFAFQAATVLGAALRAAAGRSTSRAALGSLLMRSRRLTTLPGGQPRRPIRKNE